MLRREFLTSLGLVAAGLVAAKALPEAKPGLEGAAPKWVYDAPYRRWVRDDGAMMSDEFMGLSIHIRTLDNFSVSAENVRARFALLSGAGV